MMSLDPVFLNMENGWLRCRKGEEYSYSVGNGKGCTQWIAVLCLLTPPCGVLKDCRSIVLKPIHWSMVICD